jgi:hypothetical protein
MEISEVRRKNLERWFSTRTLPPKEKSYISQLISGKSSFGEKAARRLEEDYGMGKGYLDGIEETVTLSSLLNTNPQDGRLNQLIKLFKGMTIDDQDLLLLLSNKLYERNHPLDLKANPTNGKQKKQSLEN